MQLILDSAFFRDQQKREYSCKLFNIIEVREKINAQACE